MTEVTGNFVLKNFLCCDKTEVQNENEAYMTKVCLF